MAPAEQIGDCSPHIDVSPFSFEVLNRCNTATQASNGIAIETLFAALDMPKGAISRGAFDVLVACLLRVDYLKIAEGDVVALTVRGGDYLAKRS